MNYVRSPITVRDIGYYPSSLISTFDSQQGYVLPRLVTYLRANRLLQGTAGWTLYDTCFVIVVFDSHLWIVVWVSTFDSVVRGRSSTSSTYSCLARASTYIAELMLYEPDHYTGAGRHSILSSDGVYLLSEKSPFPCSSGRFSSCFIILHQAAEPINYHSPEHHTCAYG